MGVGIWENGLDLGVWLYKLTQPFHQLLNEMY